MKTPNIEEIKDDYEREHGYDDWNEVIYSSSDPDTLDKACDEVAKRYAKEVAKQALKNASENALIKYNEHFGTRTIDKESILDENNIPEI